MTDFALRCSYRPRQHGDLAPEKRGHAIVDDGDGRRWRYHVRRGERRAFKEWLREVFTTESRKRVTGRYPYYHVE